MVLDQPLTEYSTISICDDTTPFEQIDITTYADTQRHGPDRHYLVYLSKSTIPDSPWQDKTEEEIKADWLQHLERMFPNFNKNQINYNVINRTRHAEPFHRVNSSHLIPNIRTPIENLYLATTDQIYPLPTTGEAVIEQAEQVTQMIVEDMTGATP